MKTGKWYIILTWDNPEAYTLDTKDIDASEDEIKFCILEQIYGIKTKEEKI